MLQRPPGSLLKKKKLPSLLQSGFGGMGNQDSGESNIPSFFAPLMTTVVPTIAGAPTATYTRATPATVTDWESVVRPVLSGEVRFQGARRVRNWISNSETMAGAAQNGGTGSLATFTTNFGVAPDGSNTAHRVVATLNGGTLAADNSYWGLTLTAPAIFTNPVHSVWLKNNGGTSSVLLRQNGAVAGYVVTVDNTWRRYSIQTASLSGAGGDFFTIGVRGSVTPAGAIDILVWHPQLESVEGQSNTNPSEYVSVGVLSAPFHGANVDGVKYFATQNGNTVASNVVTEATGNALNLTGGFVTNRVLQSQTLDTTWALSTEVSRIDSNIALAPDGTMTADKIVESAAPNFSRLINGQFDSNISLGTYTFSAYLHPGGGRTTARLGISTNLIPGTGANANFDLVAGTTTPVNDCTSTITSAGSGWYRCSITFTTTAVSNGGAFIIIGTGNYNGDGVSGLIAWGAQLETGSSASPYVKTTTTQASSQPLYGYLAEGARTNVTLRSEEFDNASWTKTRSTVTANAIASPDGNTTADKLVEDATAGATHFINQGMAAANDLTYTCSVWVKSAERSRIQIELTSDVGSSGARLLFNLATGLVVSTVNIGAPAGTGASGTITAFPNGWYRLTVTATPGSAGNATRNMLCYLDNGTSTTYNGDGASGLYMWGAQNELGSFASSYIPTTTASVTRNADVLTYPFAGNASATNGTIYAEVSLIDASGVQVINDFPGGSLFITGDATTIRTFDGSGSITKSGLTSMVTGIRKRTNSYGGTTRSVTGDGDTPATGVFDGSTGSTLIAIGSNSGGGESWFGTIRNCRSWRVQKSDQYLQQITTA